MSDLYGLQNALSQSNAMTSDNKLYNENVQATRDELYNSYMRDTKTDKSDARMNSDILEGKDSIAGLGGAMGIPHYAKAFKKGDGTLTGFYNTQRELSREAHPLFHGLAKGVSSGAKKTGRVLTSSLGSATTEFKPTEVPFIRQTPLSQQTSGRRPRRPLAAPLEVSSEDHFAAPPSAPPTDVNVPKTTPTNTAPTTSKKPSSSLSEGGITEDISTKNPETATESFFKKAGTVGEYAGKGMRIAGNVGGYIDDFNLIKDGFHAQGDTAQKTGEWLSGIGSLVDTIGVAIPILEPVGELLNLGGVIANTIHEVDHNKDKIIADKKNYDSQKNSSNLKLKTQGNNLTQMGLVASQNTHIGNLGGNPISTF
jgi:hypothetical protein